MTTEGIHSIMFLSFKNHVNGKHSARKVVASNEFIQILLSSRGVEKALPEGKWKYIGCIKYQIKNLTF